MYCTNGVPLTVDETELLELLELEVSVIVFDVEVEDDVLDDDEVEVELDDESVVLSPPGSVNTPPTNAARTITMMIRIEMPA